MNKIERLPDGTWQMTKLKRRTSAAKKQRKPIEARILSIRERSDK